MAYWAGLIVGGAVGVYLVHAILEWAIFRHTTDDPMTGKMSSVVAAYLLGSTMYGFGSANGGSFNPSGFLSYLPGTLIVAVIAFRAAQRIRAQIANREAGDFE